MYLIVKDVCPGCGRVTTVPIFISDDYFTTPSKVLRVGDRISLKPGSKEKRSFDEPEQCFECDAKIAVRFENLAVQGLYLRNLALPEDGPQDTD